MAKQILALAGSLRRGSLNRRLLVAARDMAPADLEVSVFDDVAGVPLFDEDLEAAEPDGHGATSELRRLARIADGLLLATPSTTNPSPG